MDPTQRLADASREYDRAVLLAQRRTDHGSAVAVAAARLNLVLRLVSCGYEPEPEVIAQVRRDTHLLYDAGGGPMASAG